MKKEDEITPWGEVTKRRKEIIETIYMAGKPLRRKQIENLLHTTANINSTLKNIRDKDGYIVNYGLPGIPILIVEPENGENKPKPVVPVYLQEDTFRDYAAKLAEITKTKPINFNNWIKEREQACRMYNMRRENSSVVEVPRLIPSWGCNRWDINKDATKILEEIFGPRPKPKKP